MNLVYDIEEVAELANISKATVYRKIKLKEIKPFIVKIEGKIYIEDAAINLIKESIVSPKGLEDSPVLIDSLKEQLEFLKEQLIIKDKQLESKDKLFENMQVLLLQEKEKLKVLEIIEAPENRDIKLVNTLLGAMDQRKKESKLKEENKPKGFFSSLKRK